MPIIAHKTLRQEAVSAIQKMLLDGQLEQGARIVEQDVAMALGVSRGPVREALRQLEQEGMVEYVANRGCFARQVSSRDVLEDDLLEMHLELVALELQNGALSDALLARLTELVAQMSHKGADTTLNDLVAEDDAFHRTIMESIQLDRVYRIWDGIGQSNIRLLKQFELHREHLIRWHREIHETLLAALTTKDMRVIRPAMMRHLIDALQFQIEDVDALKFDLNSLLQ